MILVRRLTVYLLVEVVTFAAGIAATYRTNLFNHVEISLAKIAPGLVFRPVGRGCGRGYVQTYLLLDGRKMAEGSVGFDAPQIAESEFHAFVAKASRVIEQVPNSKDRFGKEGQRFVLILPPEESHNGYVTNVW